MPVLTVSTIASWHGRKVDTAKPLFDSRKNTSLYRLFVFSSEVPISPQILGRTPPVAVAYTTEKVGGLGGNNVSRVTVRIEVSAHASSFWFCD